MEDDFIKIDDYDSRLWIEKVPIRPKDIKHFDKLLETEIQHFIHFIQSREIQYKDTGQRMYFHQNDFKTAARENIIKHSEPGVIKEIRARMSEMFYCTNVVSITMTATDIKNEFSIRQELHYVNKEIVRYLNPLRVTDDKGKSKVSTYSYFVTDPSDPERTIERKSKGRYFIFDRKDYCDEAVTVEKEVNINQLSIPMP